MSKNEIIPLITTRQDQDGGYEVVFFNTMTKHLQKRRHQLAEDESQRSTITWVTMIGPALAASIVAILPGVIQEKRAFLLMLGIFFLTAISSKKMTDYSSEKVSHQYFLTDIENERAFLRANVSRLYMQMGLLCALWIITFLIMNGLGLMILVRDASTELLIFFGVACLGFWIVVFQRVFRRARLHFKIMNGK